jgi:hypothetical protein
MDKVKYVQRIRRSTAPLISISAKETIAKAP